MRSRVVLVVLALCISVPSRAADFATLAERAAQIDAPTRGGVITLSGPIQVGHAEIVPAKGTLVRSLMAGGVPCGLVVEGPAQLLYRVDDRFTLPVAERPQRLPESLAEAAERLAESEVLRQAMGEYLHDRLVAARRAETEAVAGLDEEALVAKYRWRF